MSDKQLSKNKILDWVYNGNAAGFTIGEFTSLINLGYFDFASSEEQFQKQKDDQRNISMELEVKE